MNLYDHGWPTRHCILSGLIFRIIGKNIIYNFDINYEVIILTLQIFDKILVWFSTKRKTILENDYRLFSIVKNLKPSKLI